MAKRKIRFQPGDVVAIPISHARFAFGRIYEDSAIGIFGLWSRDAVMPTGLEHAHMLFVVGVFSTAIEKGTWKFVGRLPFPSEEDRWPPPKMIRDILDPRRVRIYHKGVMRPAGEDEVIGLEPAKIYKPEHLVERIEEELSSD